MTLEGQLYMTLTTVQPNEFEEMGDLNFSFGCNMAKQTFEIVAINHWLSIKVVINEAALLRRNLQVPFEACSPQYVRLYGLPSIQTPVVRQNVGFKLFLSCITFAFSLVNTETCEVFCFPIAISVGFPPLCGWSCITDSPPCSTLSFKISRAS